ncbi:hypothetical protein [Frankia sp. AgB32]|uniref:hypothetical protein n=1 Tax=Frankia sp. AgB32 TaxID=631119 RepID=UPI00200C54E2|nr:hypothetical protein [Frankia sp. AgB32]MCK9895030.1 hypothetical protein [Frankia sp. AgB32]
MANAIATVIFTICPAAWRAGGIVIPANDNGANAVTINVSTLRTTSSRKIITTARNTITFTRRPVISDAGDGEMIASILSPPSLGSMASAMTSVRESSRSTDHGKTRIASTARGRSRTSRASALPGSPESIAAATPMAVAPASSRQDSEATVW